MWSIRFFENNIPINVQAEQRALLAGDKNLLPGLFNKNIIFKNKNIIFKKYYIYDIKYINIVRV